MMILRQYTDVHKEIKHLEEELEKLEAKRLGPRISIITDMPTSPSYSNDQMERNLIKLEELKEKYDQLLEKLCEAQLKIEERIDKLEPHERDLIRYRYIDGLKWKDVCEKTGYSQRQMFRIHAAALKKLEDDTAWHKNI